MDASASHSDKCAGMQALESARREKQSYAEQLRQLQSQFSDAEAECREWERRALHAEKRLQSIEQVIPIP